MLGNQNKPDISKIHELDAKIRSAFKAVRDEMDDHLTSINESTEEMQTMSNHISEVETKVDKLKEQMDNIQMMLSNVLAEKKAFSLSDAEKSVFTVLYAVEQTPLSYGDIAIRTGSTELAVKAHIFAMINKGIPILERDIDGQSFFRLDKKFKEMQAKENILGIDMDLM